MFPRLAGQNAGYVARQLSDYRTGKRKSTTMQPMVEDLTPDDFQALGAYFASRPTMGHAIADPDLAQMGRFIYLRGNPYSGVASCATCHVPTPTAPTPCPAWPDSTRNTPRTSSSSSTRASARTTTP